MPTEIIHSPAPWELQNVLGCASIYDANGQDIGYLSGISDLDLNAVNGILIVMAPEMLAALQAVCREYPEERDGMDWKEPTPPHVKRCRSVLEKVRSLCPPK